MSDSRTQDSKQGIHGSSAPRQAAEDMKRKASSLLDETRSQGKQVLEQQKDAASSQVGAVANALHSAAEELHRQDDSRAGRFVSYAADQLESFGRTVRSKDIDGLIEDAERLGRRSPMAFFAGSVAIGFLVSRFLKSSARANEGDASTARRQPEGIGRPFDTRAHPEGLAPVARPEGLATPVSSRPETPRAPTTEATR